MQFDSKLFGEVRVEPQHLDGKFHFVYDALAGSMSTAKQFEIFKSVVLAVTISMMNCFFWVKFAAQMFRHHVSMLKHFRLFTVVRESGNGNPNVSIPLEVSTKIAFVESFKSRGTLVCSFTFRVAEFLLCIYSATRLAASALFFTALKAGKSLAQHSILAAPDGTAGNRAVCWILAIFAVVKANVGRFYSERFPAFAAVELDHWFVSSGAAVRRFVSGFASATTEFSFASRWLNAERLEALKANFFDACCGLLHGDLLFGGMTYSTHRSASQLERA